MLEGKLRELVQFGELNDTISERVHRMTLVLLAARDLPSLLDSLYKNMHGDFEVQSVALRLWVDGTAQDRPEFTDITEEARIFAETLTDPYFSDRPMFDSWAWFEGGADVVRSLVYLPLRAERAFGLMVMGSDDRDRFSPDQGTLYLTRLGEIVSMALNRYAGT
jgi:uncharacterized protein YigA (DUF484 family)